MEAGTLLALVRRKFVRRDSLFINVCDYGADPTGATDSAAAFALASAASVAAKKSSSLPLSPALFLPGGRYRLNSTFAWGEYSIVADTARAVEIVWGGATTGTVINSAFGWKHKRIENINFRSTGSGAVNKPQCWIDTTSASIDWGATAQGCSFSDLSSTGTAAIRLGEIVNAHLRNLRFDIGHGYCISIAHANGGSRSFSLDDFTVDSSQAAAGQSFKGVILATMASSTDNLMIRLSNARIETNDVLDYAVNSALVVIDEATPGSLNIRPADISLADITTQIQAQTNPIYVIRQANSGTSSGSMVNLRNCEFGNFNGVLGGNWSSLITIPPMPTAGQIGLWITGRQTSGATNTNWVQLPETAQGQVFRTGSYVYPPMLTTTQTLAVNAARTTTLMVPADCTITELAAEVTTAGTTGALLRAALYADDGHGYPTGSPLVDGGTVSTETTGVKTWTVSVPTARGRYHLALVAQVATCVVRSCSGVSPWVPIPQGATNCSGTLGMTVSGAFGTAAVTSGAQSAYSGVKVV